MGVENRPEMILTPEQLKLKEEKGGVGSRFAAEVHAVLDKHFLLVNIKKSHTLRAKTASLIFQNPRSGMRIEGTPERQNRFPSHIPEDSLLVFWDREHIYGWGRLSLREFIDFVNRYQLHDLGDRNLSPAGGPGGEGGH